MKVLRIVANIATPDVQKAKRFYEDVFGLDVRTDQGSMTTSGTRERLAVQINFAAEGGPGTATPDLAIEVDDVDAAHRAMQRAGFAIEYGPATEPWGVRRFYVRDPFGRLVSVLAHA